MNQPRPNLHFEGLFSGHVCGVDEAGRGPLAGPVVAAAVVLDPENIPDGLNDSKILRQALRETLFESLQSCALVGIGMAEPEEIDRMNILAASLTAMRRAVENLPIKPDAALIDGNKDAGLSIPSKTIVKGDSKSLSIAAASIIAKVTRDRLMTEANARFPGYDFARHKGYPTAAHREALSRLGACPIHRRSYAPVRAVLIA